MAGNLAPAQMFDHELTSLKGPSRLSRLDFQAPRNASASFNAGSLVSLNSVGEFVAGCPVGSAGNRPMPMFAIQGSGSFDANSDSGNTSGNGNGALVATGGFEICTTEFTGSTFAPNDLLTPDTANAGKVKVSGVSPYGAVATVGIVSRGLGFDKAVYGINKLAFWTVFFPAATNA